MKMMQKAGVPGKMPELEQIIIKKSPAMTKRKKTETIRKKAIPVKREIIKDRNRESPMERDLSLVILQEKT